MSEGARGDLEFGTIPGLIEAAAARYGERTAIEDRVTAVTYRGAGDGACGVRRARWWRGGSQRGDRVAIWAPNRWEWIVAALATHALGGVLVPLNTRFKGGEAAWILARSEARALFTVREFLGQDYLKMLEAESLPALETRVVFEGEDARALSWNAFLGGGATASPRQRREAARLGAFFRRAGRSGRSDVHIGDDGKTDRGHVHARADAACVPGLE